MNFSIEFHILFEKLTTFSTHFFLPILEEYLNLKEQNTQTSKHITYELNQEKVKQIIINSVVCLFGTKINLFFNLQEIYSLYNKILWKKKFFFCK